MGNTVVLKPATTAVCSAHYIDGAARGGRPAAGVINLVAGAAPRSARCLGHPNSGGVHFTGSTAVFQRHVEDGRREHRALPQYPRLVGETGGKDFIFAHPSRRPRGAGRWPSCAARFEYQGQKCSACSRVYVPANALAAGRERLRRD